MTNDKNKLIVTDEMVDAAEFAWDENYRSLHGRSGRMRSALEAALAVQLTVEDARTVELARLKPAAVSRFDLVAIIDRLTGNDTK